MAAITAGLPISVPVGGAPFVLEPFATAGNADKCPDEKGDGWETKVLNKAIDYKVHHKVVGSTIHLILDATSPSSGGRWLGFGFAEQNSGHMKGSDIVTATIEDGVVKVFGWCMSRVAGKPEMLIKCV